MADRTGAIAIGVATAIAAVVLIAVFRSLVVSLNSPLESAPPAPAASKAPPMPPTPTQLFLGGRSRVVAATCSGVEPAEVCRIVAGKCFEGSVPAFDLGYRACTGSHEQCFTDGGDAAAENFEACWLRNAPQYLRAKGE